jgi:hypothetical protein
MVFSGWKAVRRVDPFAAFFKGAVAALRQNKTLKNNRFAITQTAKSIILALSCNNRH